MPEPTFDRGGYPTDETLEAIEKWPITSQADCAKLLEFVEKTLHPVYGVIRKKLGTNILNEPIRMYELATGGWPGNESIVSSLERNFAFHAFCWESDHRGGLHVFHVQREADEGVGGQG